MSLHLGCFLAPCSLPQGMQNANAPCSLPQGMQLIMKRAGCIIKWPGFARLPPVAHRRYGLCVRLGRWTPRRNRRPRHSCACSRSDSLRHSVRVRGPGLRCHWAGAWRVQGLRRERRAACSRALIRSRRQVQRLLRNLAEVWFGSAGLAATGAGASFGVVCSWGGGAARGAAQLIDGCTVICSCVHLWCKNTLCARAAGSAYRVCLLAFLLQCTMSLPDVDTHTSSRRRQPPGGNRLFRLRPHAENTV